VLKKEILFSHLEQEELKDLLDAMYEKKYAAGDDIITQNDENGEEFFVMAEGEVDVIIGGNKVADMKEGSFGDLALIYGTPRAATIRATKATICFAMDRSTYRAILMGSTIKRRKMFDAILEKVEMLKDIDNFERSQVADALETEHFEDGTTIIKQGDDGTIFYIIMSGECVVTQTNEAGETGEVAQLKEADYFGEIALLTSEPRKATVTAKGATKVAKLDRARFERVLGPCDDILRRNMANYEKFTGSK